MEEGRKEESFEVCSFMKVVCGRRMMGIWVPRVSIMRISDMVGAVYVVRNRR